MTTIPRNTLTPWLRDISGASGDGGVVGQTVTPWMASQFADVADVIDELVAALRDARQMLAPFGNNLSYHPDRLAHIDAVLTRHDNRDNEKEG